MAQYDASPEFQQLLSEIMAEEMASNPDVRARLLLSQVQVYARREPSWDDFRAAGIMSPNGSEILTGLHFGTRDMPLAEHRIYLFEEPMKVRAQIEGISLRQRLDESLMHELDHALGACPPGHEDCSPDEIQETIRQGGSFTQRQIEVFQSRGLMV